MGYPVGYHDCGPWGNPPAVDDTLDSVMGGSDEEAEDDVISQVLDEIGIEVNRKVSQS